MWAANPGTAADYFRDLDFSLAQLTMLPQSGDWGMHGYTKIGLGTLTLTEVVNENQVILGIIGDLRKRQTEARAEAEEKVTRIEEQINRLLAIENKQAPASNAPSGHVNAQGEIDAESVVLGTINEDDDIPF
jgi:hypothetical protein